MNNILICEAERNRAEQRGAEYELNNNLLLLSRITIIIIMATASTSIPELSSIHEDIHTKLDVFIKNRKIPNIIFYGPRGSGKTFILNRFISSVYGGDKTAIKNYVMRANCAHGKGIRFIREELKFFAKTNIDLKEGAIFKSVILTNADKLTIDAQSALRRCIELFSYSTRFFIVVENKDSLLKPILSRFCDIYVPQPIIMGCGGIGTPVNLHSYRANMVCDTSKIERLRDKSLGELIKIHPDYLTTSDKLDQVTATATATPTSSEYKSIVDLSVVLYEQGYCGLDVIEFVRNHSQMNEIKKYELLIMFDKVRKEFRNEKLLLLFILHFIVFRCNRSLENISFM
jgi:replication factor C small subunit